MNEPVGSTARALRCRIDSSQLGALRKTLAVFVEQQLRRAASELARPQAELHCGVHEARKALRKSQAALRLGRRGLPAHAQHLRQALCRIGRSLSELRDAQALVEVLERLRQRSVSGAQVANAALKLAAQRRDVVLERTLQTDPALQLRRTQLAGIAAQVSTLDWQGLTDAEVLRALARSRRKVLTAATQARALPNDDEAWHRLRRRVRRLRHQSALLPTSVQQPAGLTSDDEALAHMLGEAQDEVVLIAACGRDSLFPPKLRCALRELADARLREVRAAVAGADATTAPARHVYFADQTTARPIERCGDKADNASAVA